MDLSIYRHFFIGFKKENQDSAKKINKKIKKEMFWCLTIKYYTHIGIIQYLKYYQLFVVQL